MQVSKFEKSAKSLHPNIHYWRPPGSGSHKTLQKCAKKVQIHITDKNNIIFRTDSVCTHINYSMSYLMSGGEGQVDPFCTPQAPNPFNREIQQNIFKASCIV